MSETKGRCRSEVDECRGSPSELKIADAIDRLAADVAVIEAKVNDIMPEDVRHFVESEKAWVRLVEEKETAAIRERDQWREEARLAVINRDEARAEVERLRAIVHSGAGHMAKILIENERLRAGPAAPKPAGQGISPGLPGTQPPRNAAPAAGWLTDEERGVIVCAYSELSAIGHNRPPDKEECLRLSAALRSVVKRHDENTPARAGSPPVVEVPELGFLGPMTGREQGIVLAYRDALDAAGVPWKEVGRE